MVLQTRADIHADHRHWQQDLTTWREDIDEWRKENETLLKSAEDALRDHVTALKAHSEAMRTHEREVLEHERFIAECEQDAVRDGGIVETSLVEDHKKETAKHTNLRQAHERIRDHHLRAMAKLVVVIDLLGKAM